MADGFSPSNPNINATGLINRLQNGAFALNPEGTTSPVDTGTVFVNWTVLTQTGAVQTSQVNAPEPGQSYAIRLTQTQSSAQRMGLAQTVQFANCADLRAALMSASGRVRYSTPANVRFALLEWDGTADASPVDVVHDWASTLYVPGQFFVSSVSVIGEGIWNGTENAWSSLPYIPMQGGASLNNLIFFVWTQDVVSQNGTLDLGALQVSLGNDQPYFEHRPIQIEQSVAYPASAAWGAIIAGITTQATSGNINVIATGATAATRLGDRFAETYHAQDFGVVTGSSADQSANMQAAFTACEGKTLILPDSDIYCKSLSFPVNGITLSGTRPAFSVTGLGTRLILPNASNTFIAASYGYINNSSTSDYGAVLDGVGFEGNKANQTVAAPLLILRTTRSLIKDTVTVQGSKGQGILLTALSANGTAINNSMPENVISARILNCDSEGFYGADGSSNKLADVFLLAPVIGSCGAANQTYSAFLERGAGAKVVDGQFYGNGIGNLRIDKFGVGCVIGNNFDLSGMTAASGTVYNCSFEFEGFASVAHVGNQYGNSLASAGAVTWQHVLFNGAVASARVSNSGNTYRSENFTITAWSYTGDASGIVNSGGETFYNCWPAQLAAAQVNYRDEGAAEGPYHDLVRYSASPAASDALGVYRLMGFDSNGAEAEYGGMRAVITSASAGSTSAALQLFRSSGGARTTALALSTGAAFGGASDPGAGNLNIPTAFYVNAVQVVSARNTGWTAFTGSTDKSTVFDTSSVTLPQLAQRVAALQAALTTHGLVGT